MFQGQTQSSPIRVRRDDIVAAARSKIGTPFRHQGRGDHGLDCVGLVIVLGKELGVLDYDVRTYQKRTNGHQFMTYFRESGLREATWADRRIGDVVVMHDQHFPCHVAVLSSVQPDAIVHAHAMRRGVLEEAYTPHWHKRFVGLYRFPGID